MADPGYEPIDVGDGRRLERFGSVVVDRPAPGAAEPRRDPKAWAAADARFERDDAGGDWAFIGPLPDPWRLRVGGLELELRAATSGQVGVFPEQVPVWLGLAAAIQSWCATRSTDADRQPAVLSLFAYTGAATLACAAAGATVVHVDGSRTAVEWARRNAELSGLRGAPIRWIVEDASTFVAREVRRGRRYDGIVLDPPSYGHGREGRGWRIDRDLEPLLDALGALRSSRPAFVALTAHTTSYGPDRLAALLDRFGPGPAERGVLELHATSGARLALGARASWSPG